MASYEVTIPLVPPRTVTVSEKEFFFMAVGLPTIKLPRLVTTWVMEQTPEGPMAVSVTLPRGIAENEGLIERSQDETTNEQAEMMTRHDWFMAAAITGFCGQVGAVVVNNDRQWINGIVAAARKIADKACE